MNKVQEVARAIRRNKFERNGRLSVLDETLPLTEGELDEARAAIKAMREPTEGMSKSGYADLYATMGLRAIYNAMIDTALEEAE